MYRCTKLLWICDIADIRPYNGRPDTILVENLAGIWSSYCVLFDLHNLNEMDRCNYGLDLNCRSHCTFIVW